MPGPTVEQLRADIDKGRTGDKIAAPDPAAAPLGADDEAAGTPPSPERIAMSREAELAQGRLADGDAQEDAAHHQPGARSRRGAVALLIAFAIAAVLVAAFLLFPTPAQPPGG